ncbi:MAG TPA: PilZ domain-containing protein [Terriglobales bacterium]|nr:PilZ domain-containing protein [Terriglobales bacterium]
MSTSPSTSIKPSSRIALVRLSDAEAELLADVFKPFQIQTRRVDQNAANTLLKEKFEGCVLRLEDPEADSVLKAARESRSNRGIVLYGISAGMLNAMKFSKYGINAVLTDPLERSNALKAVRATYLLALHEFRRYVRIPVAITVGIRVDGRHISTVSQEVSGGGMSLESPDMLPGKLKVEVSFELPGESPVTMPAEICWRREPSSTIGVRFEPLDARRQVVRNWIESYMDG